MLLLEGGTACEHALEHPCNLLFRMADRIENAQTFQACTAAEVL
jgi:hypothetical protein